MGNHDALWQASGSAGKEDEGDVLLGIDGRDFDGLASACRHHVGPVRSVVNDERRSAGSIGVELMEFGQEIRIAHPQLDGAGQVDGIFEFAWNFFKIK